MTAAALGHTVAWIAPLRYIQAGAVARCQAELAADLVHHVDAIEHDAPQRRLDRVASNAALNGVGAGNRGAALPICGDGVAEHRKKRSTSQLERQPLLTRSGTSRSHTFCAPSLSWTGGVMVDSVGSGSPRLMPDSRSPAKISRWLGLRGGATFRFSILLCRSMIGGEIACAATFRAGRAPVSG